jgi:hypothetical protein
MDVKTAKKDAVGEWFDEDDRGELHRKFRWTGMKYRREGGVVWQISPISLKADRDCSQLTFLDLLSHEISIESLL